MVSIRDEVDMEVKKKFLNGLCDRIIVNYEGTNRHNLRVFFKIPFINDSLVWFDEKNKKLGYEIKKGKKSLYLNYDLRDRRSDNRGSDIRKKRIKKNG